MLEKITIKMNQQQQKNRTTTGKKRKKDKHMEAKQYVTK